MRTSDDSRGAQASVDPEPDEWYYLGKVKIDDDTFEPEVFGPINTEEMLKKAKFFVNMKVGPNPDKLGKFSDYFSSEVVKEAEAAAERRRRKKKAKRKEKESKEGGK